jgi:hypothetical protein
MAGPHGVITTSFGLFAEHATVTAPLEGVSVEWAVPVAIGSTWYTLPVPVGTVTDRDVVDTVIGVCVSRL